MWAPIFPQSLFPREKITARADTPAATFTAAFERRRRIPDFETSICAYEAKGWDIRTNRWQRKGKRRRTGLADG